MAPIEFLPTARKCDLLPESIFGSAIFFPESHLYDLLCEDLGILNSLFDRPELCDFINDGLKYESIQDFAEAFGLEQFMTNLEEVTARAFALTVTASLLWSCQRLISRSWLNKPPKQRTAEMRELLREIKGSARSLYGFPDHRLSAHQDRDRELWRLKRMHPDWSWGKLGRKFGISNGAAELACKRHAVREWRRLNALHDAILYLR